MALANRDTKQCSESTFKCSICNKVFTEEQGIMEHLVTHMQRTLDTKHRIQISPIENPYKCTECGQTFPKITSLEEHIKTHPGATSKLARYFKCTECGQTYPVVQSLEKHVEGHVSDRQTYPCPMCQRHFPKMQALKKHFVRCNGTSVFKCDECGKAVGSKSRLAQHMSTHRIKEKLFVCDVCSKAFARDRDLKQHKKYHPS